LASTILKQLAKMAR